MTQNKKYLNQARARLLDGMGVPERAKIVPDSFQLEAIESLRRGDDTLVVAPTGAGKTYIAVEAIDAVLEQGLRAVYTAPLKALSNSKFSEFKLRFANKARVGLLTGDRKIDGDAEIIVATTEIYRNELYDVNTAATPYGLVVLDEFHYLADTQRGAVWEESVILSSRDSVLLMLSASISNAEQVAAWIEQIRGRKVSIVSLAERPVALRLAFLHPDRGVMPLVDDRGNLFDEVKQFYAQSDVRRPRGRRFQRGRKRSEK